MCFRSPVVDVYQVAVNERSDVIREKSDDP